MVAAVTHRNGPRYEGVAGPQVVGSDDLVTSWFRVMSMTKMVCT